MSRSLLNIRQAAQLLNIEEGELRTMAVQGEMPCRERGGAFFFETEDLDLWKSNQIIGGSENSDDIEAPPLSELLPRECICANLKGNSRASIIRELTALAEKSGFLYDPADFRDEITKREDAGSTNIGGGIAIPHTLTRDEGYFSETFICLAKLAKPAFFNSAPDGAPTELLILSCCTDSRMHLAILRRISELCKTKNFMQYIREAENEDELLQVVLEAENS